MLYWVECNTHLSGATMNLFPFQSVRNGGKIFKRSYVFLASADNAEHQRCSQGKHEIA